MRRAETDARIVVLRGDITRERVDAVVNAANNTLLGGGGVDGAIHRAAGPALLEECRRLRGCPTGEARITRAGNLPCARVIHTVGPVWRGGSHGEAALLASCYRACFALAAEHAIETMAFPSIATGAYRFPVPRACRIALAETRRALNANRRLREIRFVCFDADTESAYREALEQTTGEDAAP